MEDLKIMKFHLNSKINEVQNDIRMSNNNHNNIEKEINDIDNKILRIKEGMPDKICCYPKLISNLKKALLVTIIGDVFITTYLYRGISVPLFNPDFLLTVSSTVFLIVTPSALIISILDDKSKRYSEKVEQINELEKKRESYNHELIINNEEINRLENKLTVLNNNLLILDNMIENVSEDNILIEENRSNNNVLSRKLVP